MIYQILKVNTTTTNGNINEINKPFNNVTKRVTEKLLTEVIDIKNFINALPDQFLPKQFIMFQVRVSTNDKKVT